MNKTFTIKQDVRLPELTNIFFYQAYRMKILRRMFIYSICIGVFSLIVDLITTAGNQMDPYQMISGLLIVPVFFLAFFFIAIIVVAPIMMIFRPNQFKNIIYDFNHWGMVKTGKEVNIDRPWKGFCRYRESKNYFFLYITQNDAHVIQKKMLKSKEEIEDFRQLICEHITNS